MPKVVFLCKGSRGDVLPLLSIALELLKGGGFSVMFVCPPSALNDDMISLLLQQQNGERELQIKHFAEFNTRNQSLKESEGGGDWQARALRAEVEVSLEASEGAELIVYSLFSLEGHFISRHLKIPCICASPHLQRRHVPGGFKTKLSEAYPGLYHRLTSSNSPGGEVSFAEVDHWMWRMFLDDIGSVCESLGLPLLPFSLDHSGALPPPTPLLYGISPSLISCQPWWPDSVLLCGFWSLPCPFYPPPDSGVTDLLCSLPSPPLYVGYGSMETYLDIDWRTFLTALDDATRRHGSVSAAVFQCQENGPIAHAYSTLSPKLKRVHLLTQVLPHEWLFPQCFAILHHGGSGTVAAAIASGKPQIISPVMFDQEMWAGQMSWMGVAYECTHPRNLTSDKLCRALDYVSKESVQKKVSELKETLEEEDGLKIAVDLIKQTLKNK